MQTFRAGPPPPSGQEMATFFPQERTVNIKFSKASSTLAKATMKMLPSSAPHLQTYATASRSPRAVLSPPFVSAAPEKPDTRTPRQSCPACRAPGQTHPSTPPRRRQPSEPGLGFLRPPAPMKQDTPRRARGSHALQGPPTRVIRNEQRLLNPTGQAHGSHSSLERAQPWPVSQTEKLRLHRQGLVHRPGSRTCDQQGP